MQERYTRVTVTLSPDEAAALIQTAQGNFRHPRDQARYMLRSALGLTDPPRNEARECARVAETGGALPLVQS